MGNFLFKIIQTSNFFFKYSKHNGIPVKHYDYSRGNPGFNRSSATLFAIQCDLISIGSFLRKRGAKTGTLYHSRCGTIKNPSLLKCRI